MSIKLINPISRGNGGHGYRFRGGVDVELINPVASDNKKEGYSFEDNKSAVDCETFMRAANDIIDLIEKSSLTFTQKESARNDIEAARDLAIKEPSPEIEKLAVSRIEKARQALSVSADVIGVATPLFQILFALFTAK